MNTTPISVESLIGDKLQAIWKNAAYQPHCGRSFMAPYQLHPGGILFVGINPSYTAADEGTHYYDAHQASHPYFKPMRDIADAAGQPWMHLDLLYYRETEQAALHDKLATANGKEFVWEQLQLFPELLAAARPSVVVVANATARRLLGADYDEAREVDQWLGLKFEWDEELGSYRYQDIPVFFTSMLSGQRALDKGSRQRLEWHIRRALATR